MPGVFNGTDVLELIASIIDLPLNSILFFISMGTFLLVVPYGCDQV